MTPTQPVPPNSQLPDLAARSWKSVEVRQGRPDWDRPWHDAKTGGTPWQRRHMVRSGLIRQVLQQVLAYAKREGKTAAFEAALCRILGIEAPGARGKHSADVLLDTAYSRLHNSHLNIYYGRGSQNLALGTLAHGIEKRQSDYFREIDSATTAQELKTLANQWLRGIIAYAICEYVDLTPEQTTQVRDTVDAALSVEKKPPLAEPLKVALTKLALFSNAERPEGPMEASVLEAKNAALADIAEVVWQRLAVTFEEPPAGQLEALKKTLRTIAFDTLDSVNFDLSEARHYRIHKLQNSANLRASAAFTALVTDPSIEGFEKAATEFLDVENQAAKILGLSTNYQDWFSDIDQRFKFFSAITSPASPVPTVESARFFPRRWVPEIRKLFSVKANEERQQIVPTTLIRQAAWAVSNFAFATDRGPELFATYEELLGRSKGSIMTVDELQRAHYELVHTLHNNPTNLYLGRRGPHLAMQNLAFAIETRHEALRTELSKVTDEPQLVNIIESWRREVIAQAIGAYLRLAPSEETELLEVTTKAFATQDKNTFVNSLTPAVKQALELFKGYPAKQSARGAKGSAAGLVRYENRDVKNLQEKVQKVIELGGDLKVDTDKVLQNKEDLSEKIKNIHSTIDTLYRKITLLESPAHDDKIRQAHQGLLEHAATLQKLRQKPRLEEYNNIIPTFKETMKALLVSAEIARSYGLEEWVQALTGANEADTEPKKKGKQPRRPHPHAP